MFKNDLMKGRNILITGGGTGLGRSMALRFAELGANLFLVARRPEPLADTVKKFAPRACARVLLPATFAISRRLRKLWPRRRASLAPSTR